MSQVHRRRCDNKSLPSKLLLRRWALDLAGLTELRVLDLCAGEGHIWQALRSEYQVVAYTPCDIKPRMLGTVTVDIREPRYLDAFDLARFNVIDIDAYGNPFDAWLHLAQRIKQRTVVFLTHGETSARAGVNMSSRMRDVLGIPRDWQIPQQPKLIQYAAKFCLGKTAEYCTVLHAGKIRIAQVGYYGIVVEPKGEIGCRNSEEDQR